MSLSSHSPSSTTRKTPGLRRQEILQTLATLLEQPVGTKITTALLAQQLSLSEAALYRHFASKAKMYEALIEFIEEALFTRINRINSEYPSGLVQIEATLSLLLGFAAKNPGMTRVLTGEVLQYEDSRLISRVRQLNDRLEASLRQSLRLMALPLEQTRSPQESRVALQATLLMNVVTGRWHRFSSSEFSRSPLQDWDQVWHLLTEGLVSPPHVLP
ncbi:MAG: nucleoid occlusion factor SlmA [Betaproteobacteria bacterium]|jgi:cell division inhibitor SlmA|nr:nucleoid occlusion factor SlmA [Betaproteobacteria bacterium]